MHQDIVAEWSKALHLGCSLHWRRFKSCRCHVFTSTFYHVHTETCHYILLCFTYHYFPTAFDWFWTHCLVQFHTFTPRYCGRELSNAMHLGCSLHCWHWFKSCQCQNLFFPYVMKARQNVMILFAYHYFPKPIRQVGGYYFKHSSMKNNSCIASFDITNQGLPSPPLWVLQE